MNLLQNFLGQFFQKIFTFFSEVLTLYSFNQDANVFVKNIPPTMTSKQLEEEGVECGKVVSSTVRYDDMGVSLGYG